MKNNNRGFETTYVVLFPLSHYDQYEWPVTVAEYIIGLLLADL